VAEVRRVRPEEWEVLRDVRLRALEDAPDAFATTHAQALARPDDWWRDWAQRSAVDAGQAMFLAWEAAQAVGLAGAYGDRRRFDVVSMWIDPAHRGRGVASALLRAALGFAGDAPVYLGVTEGNDAARRLYERHGFVATGVVEPLRPGSELSLHELQRVD
jgi:ribosomal protein S18 acetylase RimI-like enzyme